MKFYRLEKPKYFKDWVIAILKSIGLSLLLTIAFMYVCGYKFMIVSSGSMEPTLPVGSLIIVTPCEYEDLKLYDIVTMDANGIYLTHRVRGKMDASNQILKPDDEGYDTARWYTQGDNSDTNDGRLSKNIVGRVDVCLNWVGVLIRYVKANYIMLIATGVILVVFVEVLHYLKNKLIEDDIECYDNEEE